MSDKVDNFCTPPTLASAMVGAAGIGSLGRNHYIADFAAGKGELVAVAQARWPHAKIVATDIDQNMISTLRRNAPGWQVGVCDFLNPRSRHRCLALSRLSGRANLVLLNPPFSCRGGRRVRAEALGVTVQCSIGIAFVINSVDYLAPQGTIVAVLPAGSLTSEKDSAAWELLRSLGRIDIKIRNNLHTFPGAAVHTAVLHWVKGVRGFRRKVKNVDAAGKGFIFNSDKPSSLLIRGNLQMHNIPASPENGGIPLIHTTELRGGGVKFNRFVGKDNTRLIRGPSVLIPRVGNPDKNKIVSYTNDLTFALSDCVFAVVCSSPSHAIQLRDALHANWNSLKQAYVGSGAKYVTIHRLCDVLKNLGFLVTTQSNSVKLQGG